MQNRTRQERQLLEFKKLRRDYDYLWKVYGGKSPTTKAKLAKFTVKILEMLDRRLNNAGLHRSNAVKIPLPEDVEHIMEDPDTSGVIKKEAEILSETTG